MTDLILRRITAPPALEAWSHLGEIPFPNGLRPEPTAPPGEWPGALPDVDVVVMTYTEAEKRALADVLTPGHSSDQWAKYTHGWSAFESQLTWRSPAKEAKCAATVCQTKIGAVTVLCVGSELHLSTDSDSMPVRALVQQIARETGCRLFITTGTAGGVGATEVLCDVVIGQAAKFNLVHSPWAKEPWAQQRFPATMLQGYEQPTEIELAFEKLIPAAIGDGLRESGYASRPPQVILDKDIETVGYFAFADTDDSYGVVANDPNAGCEEMDDAAVALALEELGEGAPAWVAVRNASDPQMGTGSLAEQKAAAERIYEKYGYLTTICSALACWAIIAGR